MDVIFDPAKDAANQAKHGLSLTHAADLDFASALTPKLPPPADFDDDLPELGDDFFANARRGSEVLSPEFLAANRAHLEAKRRTGRPAAEDLKVGVHIRLDAPLVRHLRAQGRGWQTRVNNALGRLIATGEL